MNPIGIMQGRLSAAGRRTQMFPSPTWRDEFARAQQLGFDRIEWLIDAGSLHLNPLLTDTDLVSACLRETRVTVDSICADCFIARPLVRVADVEREAAIDLLMRMINHAAEIGARTIVLPLLEANAVRTVAECGDLLTSLDDVLAHARACDVSVAIETDLPAAALCDALAKSNVVVCYDLGNAAAAGCDITAELSILGDRLSVVHVKDRPRNGASVPLGQGAVPFASVFATLRAIGYTGPLILETPRGQSPIDSAREQLAFVKRRIASVAVA